MNFFLFFSGGMGRGGKVKGNDNFFLWFFFENERYNLRILFFLEVNEIFNEIKIGYFKIKKIF